MIFLEDEIIIIQREVGKLKPLVYVPKIFLKLAVEVIWSISADEELEIDSQTIINAVLSVRTSALLEGRSILSYDNIKDVIYTAISEKMGKSYNSDAKKHIDNISPDIALYLSLRLSGINLQKISEIYHKKWGDCAEWSASNIRKMITGTKRIKDLEKFSSLVFEMESIYKYRIFEVISEYLSAYDKNMIQVPGRT